MVKRTTFQIDFSKRVRESGKTDEGEEKEEKGSGGKEKKKLEIRMMAISLQWNWNDFNSDGMDD